MSSLGLPFSLKSGVESFSTYRKLNRKSGLVDEKLSRSLSLFISQHLEQVLWVQLPT